MIHIHQLKRLLLGLEDRYFDWVNNIDTSPIVSGDELYSQLQDNARVYHGAWCRAMRQLFAEARRLGVYPRIFVDIGCGKGKACFYAARYSGFERIIGIDFDSFLIKIAQRNLEKFGMPAHAGNAQITFEHKDATEYLLPEEQSFVFLFNPFDDQALRLFLKNNLESFQKNAHVIGYSNDVHRIVIEQMGFRKLYRDDARKMSLWQWGRPSLS
ncbi:MAG TPA: class I SAM-dependent methyltransferase [Candidatus Paceibacterota bacterium]